MFFIYRLTDGELNYYGQTENPKRRFVEHKAPKCKCMSRRLDKSKMKMHIIHRLYTTQEADETEEFYQMNFDCVNKLVTGRTKHEWYEENKSERIEYNKKHKEENKEHYDEYNKQYHQEHKEEIKMKSAKYREPNPEKI